MPKTRSFTVIVEQTRRIQRTITIPKSEVDDFLNNHPIHLDEIINEVDTATDADVEYDYSIVDNDTDEIVVDFDN